MIEVNTGLACTIFDKITAKTFLYMSVHIYHHGMEKKNYWAFSKMYQSLHDTMVKLDESSAYICGNFNMEKDKVLEYFKENAIQVVQDIMPQSSGKDHGFKVKIDKMLGTDSSVNGATGHLVSYDAPLDVIDDSIM